MRTSRRQFFLKIWAGIAVVPMLSQCTYDVLPPVLRLLSPNGEESLIPNSIITIRWKAVNVGLLRIDFSSNDGKTWEAIAEEVSPGPEFWEWKVPNIRSTQCRIRLSEMQNPSLQDESDAVFSIQPILKLTYPNGGEAFKPGDKKTIRWEEAGVGALRIELSSTGGTIWTKVAENIAAEKESLEWEVPIRDSEKCLIRITDMTDASVQDQSDTFFFIRQSEVISLASHPELQPPQGFKVFENTSLGDIAVAVTGAGTFKVLSLSCTHAGCGVQWQGTQFLCPCHGSAFDRTGCVLNGPAQVPLWTHEFNYDAAAGIITIYNRLTPGKC